jgi:hypothetical protein
MFTNAQVTLNTLVTLEEAFIAAYLVGVRNFSTNDLKVTAARIMGIESDHRTLARVVGGDVAVQDGGPITRITGIQGVSESASPPNNNGYERTLLFTKHWAGRAVFAAVRGYNLCVKGWVQHHEDLCVHAIYPRAADGARRLPFVCGLSRGLPYSGAD